MGKVLKEQVEGSYPLWNNLKASRTKENENMANLIRTRAAPTGGRAGGQHLTLVLRQRAHSSTDTGTTKKPTPAPRSSKTKTVSKS